jgi:lipopolysaccharide/colanic/teichoic acid biosynthesis glycosyltransferase
VNFAARNASRSVSLFLWLGDVVSALGALALADVLRRALPFGAIPDQEYVTARVVALVILIWSAVFYFWGAYERRNREERGTELRTVFLATTFALLTLAAAFYFAKIEDFSRVLFAYFYILDLILGLGLRLAWRWLRRMTRPAGAAPHELRRALIVGTDSAAFELAGQLRALPEYELAGFLAVGDGRGAVDPSTTLRAGFGGWPTGDGSATMENEAPNGAEPAPVLGDLRDALRLVQRLGIDDVFISQTTRGRAELAELILGLHETHARVRMMPDLLEIITVRTGIETLRGLPLITLREPAITGFNHILKRALDLAGGALGLAITAPLMLVISILIKLDSPGPVLFTQERAGQYGKPFRMYKFRTMVPDAEDLLDKLVDLESLQEPSFKMRNDPRVTRVGRWLRRYSLDELPQFINVFLGHMSLVGPRPEVMRIAARYSPGQRQRLLVKPGLTGTMQISGRGDLSFDERMKLELDYIENYSIWRDLIILLKTVPAVLSGRGAF